MENEVPNLGNATAVTVALTQEQQALVAAVTASIKSEINHKCVFESKARKTLHDMVGAVEETKSTRSTHVIILRAGKTWEDVTGKIGKVVMYGFFVLICVVVSAVSGKPMAEFLRGVVR